jgi:hypothetical protein
MEKIKRVCVLDSEIYERFYGEQERKLSDLTEEMRSKVKYIARTIFNGAGIPESLVIYQMLVSSYTPEEIASRLLLSMQSELEKGNHLEGAALIYKLWERATGVKSAISGETNGEIVLKPELLGEFL